MKHLILCSSVLAVSWVFLSEARGSDCSEGSWKRAMAATESAEVDYQGSIAAAERFQERSNDRSYSDVEATSDLMLAVQKMRAAQEHARTAESRWSALSRACPGENARGARNNVELIKPYRAMIDERLAGLLPAARETLHSYAWRSAAADQGYPVLERIQQAGLLSIDRIEASTGVSLISQAARHGTARNVEALARWGANVELVETAPTDSPLRETRPIHWAVVGKSFRAFAILWKGHGARLDRDAVSFGVPVSTTDLLVRVAVDTLQDEAAARDEVKNLYMMFVTLREHGPAPISSGLFASIESVEGAFARRLRELDLDESLVRQEMDKELAAATPRPPAPTVERRPAPPRPTYRPARQTTTSRVTSRRRRSYSSPRSGPVALMTSVAAGLAVTGEDPSSMASTDVAVLVGSGFYRFELAAGHGIDGPRPYLGRMGMVMVPGRHSALFTRFGVRAAFLEDEVSWRFGLSMGLRTRLKGNVWGHVEGDMQYLFGESGEAMTMVPGVRAGLGWRL